MGIHAMSMLIGRAAISWSHPQTLGFKHSLNETGKCSDVGFEPAKSRLMANTLLLSPPSSI